ncbi:hypothetical protein F5Y09DRAFT_355143 [Xylaria sp. FL1042]|nr:hypothetical protein F5Y09DRAFT_355143 [Xylaria sp. FL1042]
MADRVVMPDLSHKLSTTEQRIFDNFKTLTEMAAENSAKLDKMEKAITRVEEKINSLQGSQSTVFSSSIFGQASTRPEPEPEPEKRDVSSLLPPPRLLSQYPGSPQRRLFTQSLRGLHPPRTPLREPPTSCATTPRKRKPDPGDSLTDSIPNPLDGPSDLRKSLVFNTVEEFRKEMAEQSTSTMAEALGGLTPSSASRRLGRPTALGSPKLYSPGFSLLAQPSARRTGVLPPLRKAPTRPQRILKRVSKGKDRSSPVHKFKEDSDDDDDKK